VDPVIPKSWPGFSATVRRRSTSWRVEVRNPRGVNRGVDRVLLDDVEVEGFAVPMVEDGAEHAVVVVMLGG